MSVRVIAHRGASGYRPEHTRSAYQLALDMGAHAVEPDVVPTADGVLVVRHENELSETTDIADRAEFASLRRTKTVAGRQLTGWFTEDIRWEQLSQLRCRERIPEIRLTNTQYNDREPILRLDELLKLVDRAADERGRKISVVLEVKHADAFAQAGFDMAELVHRTLSACHWWGSDKPLVIESFDPGVLDQFYRRDAPATVVQLIDPHSVSREHAWLDRRDGLDRLAEQRHGVSVHKSVLFNPRHATVVSDAHQRGLEVFVWTCRPENTFLQQGFSQGGDPKSWGRWREEWQRIRDHGVDAVFVDHPDLGLEVFGASA